ncbi:MAG: CHAD domain-containing protein, partial [Prochlorococcaceae cyanobacterium]
GKERQRLGRLIGRLVSSRGRSRRKLRQRLKTLPPQLLAPSPLQPHSDPAWPSSAAHRAALPLLRASLIRQLAVLRLHPGWGHGDRTRPGSRQERQQHELRKAFKRFRYQLELLEALEPDLRDRLLLLKRTQDSLGQLQDLVIWRSLLKRQLKGRFRQQLPELSARWRHQADVAGATWMDLRRQWLEPATGLEAWQRWLLELKIPAGP